MNLFAELKRRNVIRVGFAYAVVAWVVAQVADLALESFGSPLWVMKTILFLMAIGWVIAIFIAWAYEITPDGIKREVDVNRADSIGQQTGRKLDRLVIVVLLLAVAVLLLERFLPTQDQALIDNPAPTPVTQLVTPTPQVTPETTADKARDRDTSAGLSIAVLPFVNMSSDPEQEFFSDGISEEILNVLSRIQSLKVAARTSSFQFKGKNLDIEDIGRQLQVNHLLEGSVRKSGSTLRITAQLIEADTGFHVWSETFDRNPEDVFAIQDEIAAAIAVKLRALVSGEVATSTPVDLQAYELYLKGRGLVARRRPDDLFQAIDTLKEALEVEPEYAPALAALGKAYAILPWFTDKIPAGEAREQARTWATKSLDIDAENVEALAVLAIVFNELDINPQGALGLLNKAIKLNPGSIIANNFLGDVYFRIGDLEMAEKYETRAVELDPLGPIHLTDLASIRLQEGDYDKAIILCERALELDPMFMLAHYLLGDAYYLLGDSGELARIVETFRTLPNVARERVLAMENTLALAQGKRELVENALKDHILLVRAGNITSVFVAVNAIQLGDFDIAGNMLLEAYRKKDGRWIYPFWIRLPEQAPNSEPWQEFWRQPGARALAELRRKNGLKPSIPKFSEGVQQ